MTITYDAGREGRSLQRFDMNRENAHLYGGVSALAFILMLLGAGVGVASIFFALR